MTPHITQDNLVTLVLVCFVIVFFAAEKIVAFIVRSTAEAAVASGASDPARLYKYSRISAAALIMRFMALLVKVASSLALALGLFKAFADMANLVLPDRTFGLIVLISFCGLASVVKVVAEDLRDMFRKLLTP